jgi:hypothetical protein
MLCDSFALADSSLGSRFGISADGTIVDFDFRAVSRREVLERLLTPQGVTVEWPNRAVADELISGTFKGASSAVARQLLTQTNFVVVYDEKTSKISRIVVIGHAAGDAVSQGSRTSEAASTRIEKNKSVASPPVPEASRTAGPVVSSPASELLDSLAAALATGTGSLTMNPSVGESVAPPNPAPVPSSVILPGTRGRTN